MSITKALESYFAHLKHLHPVLQMIALPQDAEQQAEMIQKLNMIPQLIDWDSCRIENGVKHYLWNPVRKTVFHDLSSCEKAWKLNIPPSVKEYFNSYWFIDIFDAVFRLIPVVPWDILGTFYNEYYNVQLELEEIGLEMQAIPIGTHEYGRLVVNCQDEKIYALDPESRKYSYEAENLESLIQNMRM